MKLLSFDVTVVQTTTLDTLVSIAEQAMELELCCRDCYVAGKRPSDPLLASLLED
ncbi:MAG: hypothetical protein LC650_01810 [Actinobacteria bacterium]|nr:hypothetical protein [Actinomycetota bacterium]